jgi:hypothetical protein
MLLLFLRLHRVGLDMLDPFIEIGAKEILLGLELNRLFLSSPGLPLFFRSGGQLVDPDAAGIGDGINHRAHGARL